MIKTTIRRLFKLLTIAAILLFITGIALWAYLHPRPPASQAWVNGNVLTMSRSADVAKRAEAVLVADDTIVAIGTSVAIRQLAPKGTVFHDLKGRTLMPGFIEAHGHFPGAGLDAAAVDLNSPPIAQTLSIKEALQALKQRDEVLAENRWLVGFGYDDTMLEEGRHPNRAELDSVSSERPIYLIHISGHFGVANSAALRELGITKDTPNPEGGEIGRNEDGELNGLLAENAHHAGAKKAYNFPLLPQLAIVRAAVTEYARNGVTTVQSGLVNKKLLGNLSLLSRAGLIPQRLVLWPDAEAALDEVNNSLSLEKYGHRKTTIGAAKVIADGSIQGYTGYLREPYYKVGNKADDYRGYPTTTETQLNEQLPKLHCGGRQLAVHGNGDAAIDSILNAWEKAMIACPKPDPRMVLIHAQMARQDQLERMKNLGVTPSFFNAHVYYWGDRHRDIFMGPERAARISPSNSAEKLGLRYSLHLDTPVVPIDPLLAVWNAATRETASGQTLGAQESITAEQALRAVTIDAAWQMFLDDKTGSLEPGKIADLVVLSSDPTDPAVSDDIRAIAVEETFVGGVRIYAKP